MWSNKHLKGFREKPIRKGNTETSSSNWELEEASIDKEGQHSHKNIHRSCILVMHKAIWTRQTNRIKNMRWRKARIQWAVTVYQPEGDLTPFGQIWRTEKRSKAVAFGTNGKGREESSQAAEIKTKLPGNRGKSTQPKHKEENTHLQ